MCDVYSISQLNHVKQWCHQGHYTADTRERGLASIDTPTSQVVAVRKRRYDDALGLTGGSGIFGDRRNCSAELKHWNDVVFEVV